jgi:hypothetical protein
MCAENPSVSLEGGWFMGNNCILNDRKKDRKEEVTEDIFTYTAR